MDEQHLEPEMNEVPLEPTKPTWTPPPPRTFFLEARDRSYGVAALLCAMGAANCLIWGGINIGLALFMTAYMGITWRYLMPREEKPSTYAMTVIAFTMAISLSFLRNGDGALKCLLLLLVLGAYPLGVSILSGRNRRDPNVVGSILDAGNAVFIRGFGDGPVAISSLMKNRGEGRRGSIWSVVKGLLLAVPVLLVLLVLLRSADAAFERLLELLPDINLGEIIVTLIFGSILSMPLLGMGISLAHEPKKESQPRERRGAAPATVNTVLVCICVVYVLYLLSQTAYFFNGFGGLLPQGYTMAEYARRGFFEMAVICAINLGIIGACMILVAKENGLPSLTRSLCIFIGAVTLVLIGSAMSKMILYIGSYGLTYLRVLTSLFMLWLALAVLLVGVSLFKPVKFMKTLVIAALAIAAVVSWAGLDTLVAKFNVDSYLSGNLYTVDVDYLEDLGAAGVPYLAKLLDCPDQDVAWEANSALVRTARWGYGCIRDYTGKLIWEQQNNDIREWNISDSRAEQIIYELVTEGRLKA